MEQNTRPRGARTTILDNKVLAAAGRKAYQAAYNEPCDTLEVGYSQNMLFAVDRGIGAVVNDEGVGAEFTDEDTVNVYYRLGISIFPLAIPVDDINNAVTDERVDLADGIRTFGARLDANHATWFRRYDHDYQNL